MWTEANFYIVEPFTWRQKDLNLERKIKSGGLILQLTQTIT